MQQVQRTSIALCHAQHDSLPREIALCFQLPADGSIPEWVELIPPGPRVVGRDGRQWLHDQPEQVLQELNAQGRDLVLDWEHSTELKAPKGDEAPAAGWFREYQLRDGKIFGRLELTERGLNSVKSKEYRYISPVLVYEKDSLRIVSLSSVGLTNKNNLHLQALNHQQHLNSENNVMLKDLLILLGLAADTTQEVALNHIKALQGKVSSLTEERDALNTKLQTALNHQQTPSLEKFVPRGDYDAAVARANNAEQQLADSKKTELEKAINSEIDAALKAGKITPATKEYHTAQCRQEGGLERFREFVKAAPVIGDPSDLDERKPEDTATALNAEQAKVAAMFGNSAEDLKKYANA